MSSAAWPSSNDRMIWPHSCTGWIICLPNRNISEPPKRQTGRSQFDLRPTCFELTLSSLKFRLISVIYLCSKEGALLVHPTGTPTFWLISDYPYLVSRSLRRCRNAAMSWRYTLVMPSNRHVPFALR